VTIVGIVTFILALSDRSLSSPHDSQIRLMIFLYLTSGE